MRKVTVQDEAEKLAKIIYQHMEIDCMNLWIQQTNDLRYMLLCGGIKPGWEEMKLLDYP